MTMWQGVMGCMALALSVGCVGSGGGSDDPLVVGRDAGPDVGDAGGELDAVARIDAEAVCEFPPSQGASEPCCLSLGIDGCGADLFCAAFDGRRQATCYAEGSRLGDEACGADAHCESGACDTELGRCLGVWGEACSVAAGCAQSTSTDRYIFCDPDADICEASTGRQATLCAEDSHCMDNGPCVQGHCMCLPLGDRGICSNVDFGDGRCQRDSDCEGAGEGAWQCLALIGIGIEGQPYETLCVNTCADGGDCAPEAGECRPTREFCLVASEDP